MRGEGECYYILQRVRCINCILLKALTSPLQGVRVSEMGANPSQGRDISTQCQFAFTFVGTLHNAALRKRQIVRKVGSASIRLRISYSKNFYRDSSSEYISGFAAAISRDWRTTQAMHV